MSSVLSVAGGEAHPNSVSYAEISIDSSAIHGLIRLPLDDVDLLIRLDRDLDGQVSPGELEAQQPAISAYLARHVRVVLNGAPAPLRLDRVAVWRDPSAFQYLESHVSSATGGFTGHVQIQSDVLTELYPSHKTLARISVAGGEERFTFDSGATYDRSIGASRLTSLSIGVAGLALLGLLWLVRRKGAVAAALVLIATAAGAADVIMSAPGLNQTLKAMERLKRESGSAEPREREEALFRLGVEADGLASIMNLEVESHGMQERELLDLALTRTRELAVGIAYNRGKKKFFYDGAAFADYLKAAPRGPHAPAAEFKLLSYQFYQSTAADDAALIAAAEAKKQFLARYPRFEHNAELRLYLAVDYQDLFRRSRAAHDAVSAARYQRLARAECLHITRQHPQSEPADAARQLLRGLDR